MSNELPASPKAKKGSSYRIRRITQMWPLLIWIGALAFFVYLYINRGGYERANGMVFSNTEDIAAPEDGVIKTVHVRDGDTVKRGDTLVTLDPTLLEREMEQLRRTLVIEALERKRRFQANFADARDALAQAQAEQARDQVDYDNAVEAFEQAKIDRQNNAITELQLQEAERLVGELNRKLGTHTIRIMELSQIKQDAFDLLGELPETASPQDPDEKPKELVLLEERLKAKTIVADSDGVVQKVHKLRGVTRIGDPILTIIPTDDDSDRAAKLVRGFVRQTEHPEELHVGDTIWISERVENPVAYPAEIVSVAPDITAIENYGTQIAGGFLRGREFLCQLPDDLAELLPGTSVVIHREEPGKFNIWTFGRNPVKAAAK